jgi:hypothetical protein
MREADYVAEGTELVGKDIMDLASQICPKAPRVIHSGMYKIDPEMSDFFKESKAKSLKLDREDAQAHGYMIYPKQESQSKRSHRAAGPVREIDAYLRERLDPAIQHGFPRH